MRTSEKIELIAAALAKAQEGIKHATKDAQNPHLKNNYATLESCIDASKEHLLKNNVIVIQSPTGEVLTTRLQHTSGQYFESDLKLFLGKQDMQGLGSAITYARRYSLAALLNISQTDDDGEGASDDQSGKSAQKDQSGNSNHTKQRPPQKPASGFETVAEALVDIKNKDLAKAAGFKWSGKKWTKLVDANELESQPYDFEIREVRA